MVRNYKRKTDRGKWDSEDMKRAVNAVLTNKMGFLRASATYDVPKSTLERRVRKARDTVDDDTDSGNDYGKKHLGRFKTVFTAEQEDELAQYVKSMEARLFGLTGKELRVIAYQLAQRNHIDNPFNEETGMAGEDWLSEFLKRHPDLAYRRPEPTSAARAMAFNRVAVDKFFSLLENVVDKHKLTPERIYNVDETGISTVPKSQSKILSMKGQKQVGCLSSAERGQLVTAEICFNAAGTYVPPMLIYARKRMRDELLDDAPPGFWGTCSDNGWITSNIFFDWFKSFVQFTQPTKEKPVLLLLDGHASHTKNIDLIDYARENNVILLCTPPHCTHKLQPLDVAFMRPLSTYYSAEVKKWLRDHPGRVVTPYQVAKLFGQAYLQAATMLTAINGFRKCGIWPVDKNVFTDADFVAAETTNTENLVTEEPNVDNALSIRTNLTSEPAITEENQPRPSTSAHLGQIPPATQQNNVTSSATSFQTKNVPASSKNTEDIVSNINLDFDKENVPDASIYSGNTVDPVLSSEKNNVNELAVSSSNKNFSLSFQIDILRTTSPSLLLSSQNVDTTANFNSYSPEITNTRKTPELTSAEEASTSTFRGKEKTPERQIKKGTSSFLVSPENIMAIPKEVRTQERKTRKRGKTAILTESPYKNDLIKDISFKKDKNKKKTNDQKTDKDKKLMNKVGKKTVKKIKKTENKRQAKRLAKEIESEDSSSQEEDDDCACLYCGYLYSESTEGWVICSVCHGWAHNSCAGVDEEDDEAHICERCLPD